MRNGNNGLDRILKVEAIIIAHRDFGEADRIVRIFTQENGKLNTLAKGVRKIKSRKAAHLEPFTHASLILARGHTFWIVTQADTLSNFPNIREDLEKTADASYILELIDRVSSEGQPEQSLFRLLMDTLKRIEALEDTFNAVRYFEFRFLDVSGFRPDLTNCVSCKKTIKAQDQYFSPLQGGVLCPQCGPFDEKAMRASQDALRYMRHFQRSPYRDIAGVAVPEKMRLEMQKLLSGYIAAMLEWRLNTPGFKQQIKDKRRSSK